AGEISISLAKRDGSLKEIWIETKSLNNTWQLGQVNVESGSFINEEPYQVYIKGWRNNNNSIIALDEFKFDKEHILEACHRIPDGPMTDPPVTTPTPTASPNLWSCSFENDFCNMNLNHTGVGEWLRETGIDTSDHSSDSICLATSGCCPDSIATATLPHIEAEGLQCLTFWYLLDGAPVGSLNVKIDDSYSIWSRNHPEGLVWQYAQVDLENIKSQKVTFESVYGNNDESIRAVDDIVIQEHSCDVNKNECTFEDPGQCSFTVEENLSKWQRTRPKDESNKVPHVGRDHTYLTAYGHYMEVALVDSENAGIASIMTTTVYDNDPNGQQCFKFYYVHDGMTNNDRLTVNIRSNGNDGPVLWSEKAAFVNQWQLAQVPIPAISEKFQVIFTAKQGSGRKDNGSLEVDDIYLSSNPCPSVGNCNFQHGTCGWQNLIPGDNTEDKSDWIVGNGNSGEAIEKPDADHNDNKNGNFLYFDTSFEDAGRSLLQSQMFTAEQHNDLCFSFWFYLKGDQESVELWVELMSDDGKIFELWHEWADGQTGKWIQGQVHLSPGSVFEQKSYMVFIGGSRKEGVGDILALDDFTFKKDIGSCPKLPSAETTTNKPITTTSKLTTADLISTTTEHIHVDSFNCDFNWDKCGWNEDNNADDGLVWQLGGSTSDDTGPGKDHTSGD
ncbi:unnamed protein product, partial [Meganyctiphanes norvegica]